MYRIAVGPKDPITKGKGSCPWDAAKEERDKVCHESMRQVAEECRSLIEGFKKLGMAALVDRIAVAARGSLDAEDLRGLKSIKSHLLEMKRGLSSEQRALLEALSGKPTVASTADEEVVKVALARGRIDSEEEFEVVSRWFEFAGSQEEGDSVTRLRLLID